MNRAFTLTGRHRKVKNMKKGIITTLIVILLTVACMLVTAVFVKPVIAATTWKSRTICLEDWVNGSKLSDPYLILMVYEGDLAGAVVNAETGAVAADTTWEDGAFDEDHWTAHAVSGYPVYTIPALSNKYLYRIFLFDAASPANTDAIEASGFYDPEYGRVYGNNVPLQGNRVITSGR
jgi:hypothetical protein